MKITCPKCLAAYRVDLPDSEEAGIDVQCGKCLTIFLFSPNIEKPEPSGIQSSTSIKTWDSDLSEDHSSEPILPPQKDEDQELSGTKKYAPPPTGQDQETLEELELGTLSDDPEPIEILVEDDTPVDSLEKEALDDIWDQAMQEGARTTVTSKEKSPTRPSEKPVAGPIEEETPEETSPSSEKESQPLPSLEDRQREIDQIVNDFKANRGELEDPPLAHKAPQQEKAQEEVDLEEQVTINEEEAMPSWEEAFAHQAEIEAGWNKAQEQDRIHEEQQLADALDEKVEPTSEKTATTVPEENKQSLVDEIFAKVKGSQSAPKETAKTPQPKSEADPKQDAVDQIFAEAKAQQEKNQEEIDLEEEVVIEKEAAMPSWAEAFAHQSKVEDDWKKAKELDQIQEEQQLAEALGEEYVPTVPVVSESSAVVENPQAIVDDIFAQMKSQAQSTEQPPEQETLASHTAGTGTTAEEGHEPTWTDAFADQSKIEESWGKPDEQEDTGETATVSENKEDSPFDPTISSDIDLTTDLINMDMKQLVEQAFKEESEQTEEAPLLEEVEAPTVGEATPEPEHTLEMEAETPVAEQTAPVSHDEEDIDQTIDYYANYVDPPASTPEEEPIPELTLESAEEEPEPVEAFAQEEELISELTLESAEEEPELMEAVAQEEQPETELEIEEEYESTWTDAFADPSEIEDTRESLEEAEEEPVPVEAVAKEEELEIDLEPEPVMESAEIPVEAEATITESLEIDLEPEPVMESAEIPVEAETTITESLEIDLELEPVMESAEIPVEAEATITESLEIDLEPELTLESHEATALSEEQPAMGQKPSLDEESKELWADLLPELKEGEQPVHEEAPASAFVEEEGPFGGNDFWDQVLEKDSQESQTADTEAELQPVASASPTQDSVPAAQSTAEREALTDEELWQQAFPGEEVFESTSSRSSDEESSQSNIPPLVIGADVNLNEESEDFLKYDEAAYADYEEEDEDEFEFQRKKRNLGPFTIPHGRRGDLVIGGAMVVFLLLAGSVYFTLQTFAPSELTDIQTAQTEVPEGLSPREVPLD